jgi:membrane protease YdiL (CAAX protease family)
MPWDFAVILVVLSVVVPWRGTVQLKRLLAQERVDTADRIAVYASTIAFQWLAAGIVIWRSAARGLTPEQLAVALPDAQLSAAVFVVFSALLLMHQMFSLKKLARLPAAEQGILGELARKLMPQNLVERLAFFALAGSVALCEEIIYRGFAFAALQTASGSLLVAAAGSSLLFAIAHLYQGQRGIFATFLVGLLFAGVRVWTGSLAPCIGAHLLVDLYAGLAAPAKLRAPASVGGAPDGEGLGSREQDGDSRRT